MPERLYFEGLTPGRIPRSAREVPWRVTASSHSRTNATHIRGMWQGYTLYAAPGELVRVDAMPQAGASRLMTETLRTRAAHRGHREVALAGAGALGMPRKPRPVFAVMRQTAEIAAIF